MRAFPLCSAYNWLVSLLNCREVTPTGIEPVLPPWKGDVLTAWPWSHINSPSRTWTYDTSVNSRVLYHWAIEDYFDCFAIIKVCTFKTSYRLLDFLSSFITTYSLCSYVAWRYIKDVPQWLSPRPISNSQLHMLPCFHLCPIYLVVFKGSYSRRRDISSWGGLHA